MQFIPESLRTGLWQRSFALLDRLPAFAQSRESVTQNILIGNEGEEAALFHLRRQGYLVVAHGWRSERAPGDLDLVAWDDDTLCFVEVKTRSTRGFATAEAAIDSGKRKTLRRLARHYLRQCDEGTLTRFDVLSIYFDGEKTARARRADYQLFRDAFGWEEHGAPSPAERLR